MSLIDKAKELSGQAVEKVGDLGGDDLIVNTTIRGAEKKERINLLLEEKGSDYRIVVLTWITAYLRKPVLAWRNNPGRL